MKILLSILVALSLHAQTGYLQQTIKSTKNTICIYKYSNGLYAFNVGRKSICPQSKNLKFLLK